MFGADLAGMQSLYCGGIRTGANCAYAGRASFGFGAGDVQVGVLEFDQAAEA
jgi:hypothetical protein